MIFQDLLDPFFNQRCKDFIDFKRVQMAVQLELRWERPSHAYTQFAPGLPYFLGGLALPSRWMVGTVVVGSISDSLSELEREVGGFSAPQ